MNRLVCRKCGSSNISVQISTVQTPKSRHGAIYWILIGWWLHPLLWLFLTLPMLIWRVIHPNRKTNIRTQKIAVCQQCGYSWSV
ncbi:hypothetical protein [Bifidobacterium psychraerophilum]|uniref:hypothetical protein n=1 Tax=Bifidobacterium psychraerophilum TaxID=218140 RepID=UPI0039E9A83D